MKSSFRLVWLPIVMFFAGLSCQDPLENTIPLPDNRNLSLETKDLMLPATLTLTRNGSIQSTFFLHQPDTSIYDSTLKASTDYTWQILLKKGDQTEKTSNVLAGRTLDTTSHNFTWQVDTLGYYLSIVRDVAIVNENNIWAVGAFYKKHADRDSTVADRYNAAHWDGKVWTLKKIPTQDFSRFNNHLPPGNYPYEINCIWVVDENNIWGFSEAGSWVHFNGKEWTTNCDVNVWCNILKIWGSSSSNLYFVGTNGGIFHYNGSTFTRVPYPDVVDFVDVWGDQDGVVRAVGNKQSSSYYSEVVRITPASATVEFTGLNRTESGPTAPPDLFYSVWWKQSNQIWFQADNGSHFYKNNKFRKIFSNGYGEESNHGIFVRGNSNQDIAFCGVYGQVFHFNGSTVKRWRDPGSIVYYIKCAIKGNTIVAGGWDLGTSFDDQTRAVITIGKRN